jgi:transposase
MKLIEIINEAPSRYGQEGKPEWFDRAVQMKLDNPRISATEIARQIGTDLHTVMYWLTGVEPFTPMMARPKDSFPFKPEDFPRGTGAKKYYDGAKPEWYDQALQMAKAGGKFNAIAKKLGISHQNVSNWLVKGRKTAYGKLINPDAELEPRRIIGQKLDINLLNDFIEDGYTDEEIIELIIDEKGPQIASQVKNMLPTLRQKLKPATQVIDKTRTGSMRDPDITGFVK